MRTECLPKVFALPKAPACQHRRQAGAADDGTPANHLLVRFVFHRSGRLLSMTQTGKMYFFVSVEGRTRFKLIAALSSAEGGEGGTKNFIDTST